MSKEIYISSTPHETRLAIVEKDELSEIYYERENEYTLAGSIYNGRVTRVLPGMQSAFVDVGLERDAFLYITDFMEEQGDAADFEGASETKRGGERPERSGERSPERSSERAGERPERSGERSERGGERSERSGRRGDRGARPGGGEVRDASAASAERAPRQEAAPKPAEADFSPDEEMEGVPSTSAATGEAEDAEGSRRWRGRRGRRRGRSGEPRTAAAFGTDTAEAPRSLPFPLRKRNRPFSKICKAAPSRCRCRPKQRPLPAGSARTVVVDAVDVTVTVDADGSARENVPGSAAVRLSRRMSRAQHRLAMTLIRQCPSHRPSPSFCQANPCPSTVVAVTLRHRLPPPSRPGPKLLC